MIIEPRQKVNVERLKLLMSEPGVEAVTWRKRSKLLRYFHFHNQSFAPSPAPHLLAGSFLVDGGLPPGALCKLKASSPRPLGIPSGAG